MITRKYSGAFEVVLEKNNNWNQTSEYLKACEYVDRNDDICKTRIHNLTNVYGKYLDNKRNSTGPAPMKKPPCFDKLDKVLSEKPTTLSRNLLSSSGLQNGNLQNMEERRKPRNESEHNIIGL